MSSFSTKRRMLSKKRTYKNGFLQQWNNFFSNKTQIEKIPDGGQEAVFLPEEMPNLAFFFPNLALFAVAFLYKLGIVVNTVSAVSRWMLVIFNG